VGQGLASEGWAGLRQEYNAGIVGTPLRAYGTLSRYHCPAITGGSLTHTLTLPATFLWHLVPVETKNRVSALRPPLVRLATG
jgi:hypothetical protein